MTAPTKSHGFTQDAIAAMIAQRQEPDWVAQRRQAAWADYTAMPMPDTRKDEEWRRTSLRELDLEATSPLGAVTTIATAPLAPQEELAASITLVDGVVTASWRAAGLPEGVVVTDLRSALTTHPQLVERYFMTQAIHPSDAKFAALHGAFWDNGVLIYVPRGVVVELPIGVVVEAATVGRASLHHTLIILERQAQLRYVEEFRGGVVASPEGQAFSSRALEILLGDSSMLDVTSIQRFGPRMFDFYQSRAIQGKDSNLILHTIELGARLSKGHIEDLLEGSGATSKLNGLYFADGNQHLDRFTLQDHRGASTTSDLLFKGIVTDTARSVYSGYIRVHPGAKQTRAYQQNRNIQLSRKARADSNPSLEISENDILGCTHGATVGKVDEEQLFYLMCRGLSRAFATELIVEGFVTELIDAIPLEAVRVSLRNEINQRIERTTAAEEARGAMEQG